MVVSREKHATAAGLQVLKNGGNAIDAATAVGLALAVTHPSAGNLGGGGFMLIRLADGRTTFIDFREHAPMAASRNMYLDANGKATQDSILGYRAVGRSRHRARPGIRQQEIRQEAVGRTRAPGRGTGGQGLPASPMRSRNRCAIPAASRNSRNPSASSRRTASSTRPANCWCSPTWRAHWGASRKLGSKDFYEGETARLLAKDMAAHGGLITEADMKAYAVHERAPLTGDYHGYTIVTAPPPSSGGVGILQMLGMLDTTGYEKGGAGSATVLHYMTEAMRRYFADRSENLGDPDFFKVPMSGLLSPTYIARQRASIDPERATPSSQIKAARVQRQGIQRDHAFHRGRRGGNVVAVTYTLNGGFGSKVTATGLGFLLNNEMDDFAPKPGEANMYGLIQGEANAIQPGKTPLSSMTPTIVLKDGKPVLAVGSPGGPTIINTVLEVIVNVIDFGMNVQDAVNWPRFHHQWLPDELRVEPGISPDTVSLLEKRGYIVKRIASQGEAAAIHWNNGWLEGAPDPRTEGTAEGH